MKTNKLTTKRFVIRKSLIGENAIITFTNNKDITFTYDHDEITQHIKKSLINEVFSRVQSYTNSNTVQHLLDHLQK